MGPLPASFALCCRTCGAPRTPDEARCAHCGSTERPDAAALARLRVHRARMRRALQELRVTVSRRVAPAVVRRWLSRWIPALILGCLTFAGVLVVATVLSLWLTGDRGFLGLVGALVIIALCVLLTTLGLVVCYYALMSGVTELNRESRRVVLGLTATTPVTCGQCGGHAAVVALGPEDSYPCPWCGSALLPAAAAEAAVRAVAQALLDAHVDEAERLAGAALEPRRRAAVAFAQSLPGFELAGGGAVVRGATAGVSLRAFYDFIHGVTVQRVEVSLETGIDGEVWLVRPSVEAALRPLTLEWGYSLSEREAPCPWPGWRGYSDGGGLPEHPALSAALERLGPPDALLLDAAGLSLWRRGRSLGSILSEVALGGSPDGSVWSLLVEHHQTMAALASQLASRVSASPPDWRRSLQG